MDGATHVPKNATLTVEDDFPIDKVYKKHKEKKIVAEIAQLGERTTEDRQVPGSIPGFGIFAPPAR